VTARLYLTAAVVVVAVVAREIGRLLVNIADAIDPGNDARLYVPDAFLVERLP